MLFVHIDQLQALDHAPRNLPPAQHFALSAARTRGEEGWAEAKHCAKVRCLRAIPTDPKPIPLRVTPETLLDIPCSQDASFTLAYSPFRAVSCFLLKTCTATVPTYILWNAASWSRTKSQILQKATATARRHTAVPKMKTKTLRSWHIVSPTSSRSRRRWCSPMGKISFDSVPLTAATAF